MTTKPATTTWNEAQGVTVPPKPLGADMLHDLVTEIDEWLRDRDEALLSVTIDVEMAAPDHLVLGGIRPTLRLEVATHRVHHHEEFLDEMRSRGFAGDLERHDFCALPSRRHSVTTAIRFDAFKQDTP